MATQIDQRGNGSSGTDRNTKIHNIQYQKKKLQLGMAV